MLVQQFIHQLNNTELGRTGTHDCYVYVSKETVPQFTFLKDGERYQFVYKRDSSVVGELFYTHTSTGEYRVSGCKKFFDAGEVNAGDCIVLERVGDDFWVDFIKRNDVIVFNKLRDRWQCRNEDRLARYLDKEVLTLYGETVGNLVVKYHGNMTKRTQTVKTYSLSFDGEEILDGDIFNLLGIGGVTCLSSAFKDKIVSIEWRNYE
jgi:hypothetical protein